MISVCHGAGRGAGVGDFEAVIAVLAYFRFPDIVAHQIHRQGLCGGMKLYRGGARLAGTDGTFMPAVESVWVMVAAVIETSEVSGRDVHIIRVPRLGAFRWTNVYGR